RPQAPSRQRPGGPAGLEGGCASPLLLPLPPRGPAGPARRRGRGDPLRLRRGLRLPAAADRARTDRQRAQRARDRALGPGLLLRRRWERMAEGLSYLVTKHPELLVDSRNAGRMCGQVAFAYAAAGEQESA